MSTDHLDGVRDLELRETIASLMAKSKAEERDPKLVAERRAAYEASRRETAMTRLGRYEVPNKIIGELRRLKVRETEPIAFVRQWQQRQLWNLMLSGDTGLGKDFAIAYWLYEDAIKIGDTPGYSVSKCWFSVPLLVQTAMGRYGRFDPTVTGALSSVPVLVLEDMGAEDLDRHGKVLSWYFSWLNERHKHGRTTFITTNLGYDEFRKRLGGKRIFSRLSTNGMFAEVKGPNLRRKGEAEKLPPLGHKRAEQMHLAQGRVTRRSQPYRLRIRPLSRRALARRAQLELRFV